MLHIVYCTAVLLSIGVSQVVGAPSVTARGKCRCVPGDPCWPSEKDWAQFNETINGKLIRALPAAATCYSGPLADAAACQIVSNGFSNATFEATLPLGYAYPLNSSCLLVPFGKAPSADCTQGTWPVYAINVTTEQAIADGIRFAQQKNLRLAVKSTGHDVLQRSSGLGSLSIWLHHLRNGLDFSDYNLVATTCLASSWNGSTLRIAGSYPWSDIYPAAEAKGLIVVGGNNKGPSSTGGWTQGGGHSPVTRQFGIGAEQVLQARVVLASGQVVTANPCQHQHLFYAVRGGGGGTYGVVTEVIVKTYPTTSVHVANLLIGSHGEETAAAFLDAVAAVYSAFPELSRAGFAGYGEWLAHRGTNIEGTNFSNIFSHSFTRFGETQEESKAIFKPFADKVTRFNDTKTGVGVSVQYASYTTYGSYYVAKPGTDVRVGAVSALSSRLLDAEGLSANPIKLRSFIDVASGSPDHPIAHTIVQHGLQVTKPQRQDSPAAIYPGWYSSIILDIFELEMNGFQVASNADRFAHLRQVVAPAYEGLSPATGTYMNEADWGDAQWQKNFYGSNWDKLNSVKRKYDPNCLFYCPTCIGSQDWGRNQNGALCKSA